MTDKPKVKPLAQVMAALDVLDADWRKVLASTPEGQTFTVAGDGPPEFGAVIHRLVELYPQLRWHLRDLASRADLA